MVQAPDRDGDLGGPPVLGPEAQGVADDAFPAAEERLDQRADIVLRVFRFRQVSRQIRSGGIDQPWRAVSLSGDGEHIAQGCDFSGHGSPVVGHGLLAPAALAQGIAEPRCQLGFPVTDRLVAEGQTAQQQDLRQVPQAEFHPQPPQHDQKHDRYNLDNFRLWDAQTL